MCIIWQGGQSAVLGAACGLQENDLKRVIAFSTTSQQGYMVLACGLGLYTVALFHLVNHAFFKAQLFLSAGSVIHAVSDEQDMRKMGSLILFLPITYSLILLGSLSQMAFPFLTGFYSKDQIIELSMIPNNQSLHLSKTIAYFFTVFAAFLSSLYSVRLLILTFLSKPHFSYSLLSKIHEPNFQMLGPLLLLALGASFFGYLFQDTFLGIGSTIFDTLFIHPKNQIISDSLTLSESTLKFIPLFSLLFLFTIFPLNRAKLNGILFSGRDSEKKYISKEDDSPNKNIAFSYNPDRQVSIYTSFLNHQNTQNSWIIFYTLSFGNLILRNFDRGLIEHLGPTDLIIFFKYLSFNIEFLNDHRIINYACSLLFYSLVFILLQCYPYKI